MATPTAEQVKIIIETTISDPHVDAFIADAGVIMASNGVNDVPCHTEDSLGLLQKQLAAHLIALKERQLTREKIGPAEEDYGGKFGMGLEFTQYGQMVKVMDCSGILEGLGKIKADIAFFGGAGC